MRSSLSPEKALLTGPLEETNLPYDAFTVMPANVYGIGDNLNPENSHVVAGMLRRFHEAKLAGANEVVVWGTGSHLRELIDADDLADACIFLLRCYDRGGMINVGSGEEI
jgi:GDP-L-fucose synthase